MLGRVACIVRAIIRHIRLDIWSQSGLEEAVEAAKKWKYLRLAILTHNKSTFPSNVLHTSRCLSQAPYESIVVDVAFEDPTP